MKYEELGIKDKMSMICGNENINVLTDDIYETSRWSNLHELIFELNGKYYRTHYSIGKTEYQDESPWEYDEPDITEVEPIEKMVIVYEDKH